MWKQVVWPFETVSTNWNSCRKQFRTLKAITYLIVSVVTKFKSARKLTVIFCWNKVDEMINVVHTNIFFQTWVILRKCMFTKPYCILSQQSHVLCECVFWWNLLMTFWLLSYVMDALHKFLEGKSSVCCPLGHYFFQHPEMSYLCLACVIIMWNRKISST